MRIDILTLFPEMFSSPFNESIIDRARKNGLLEINTINIRDFALDKHRQVDDYPYGGGSGMVMKADVVSRAIKSVKRAPTRVIYLSPQGKRLHQDTVVRLSQAEHLILLCGHYEGIDERIMPLVDEEISIGDYVLTGGELGAMVLVDAVARLIPGVLGDDNSSQEESFTAGLLEYPQYTRPRVFEGREVPEVLLSGHHAQIRRWRKKLSLLRTLLKRPDLLLDREYDKEERQLLEEILFAGEEGCFEKE
ncbi:tRNA (guanine-N1-)-methyltransferase, bacteria [Syntrophomonas zehnderi OL-4]|uniref:tRNA (guanine-N(1)-)-methyltransferase n=1 Tax=Syntrophomonas zehnderi OL-4 TaxID=690567 RepID=A0A0E4C924_9FIRM|nr:tRNA (guanosine(37)-N1)-methyltransferase TrmD [Syntrophomonas zehnderi]CFX82489.1 tRNA (guanine-N1-)-methyltransferase, bacteria [Syntrophomonas zehnderi OL-4]